MNKNGFTLIELLATITILVLMSVIIGVNITSILKGTEENEEKFDKEQIEKAACVYVDSTVNENEYCKNTSTTCTSIKVYNLYTAGLISDEKYQTDTRSVKVCYKGNEKICEFECTENCKCN